MRDNRPTSDDTIRRNANILLVVILASCVALCAAAILGRIS